MIIIDIILFLLSLSFLVIIHELGHFITARIFRVKIEEFGIGYPPRALTLFRWKGIPFTLNWVPFGGFVKMEGEDGGIVEKTEPETSKHHKPTPHHSAFFTKTKMQRLIIVLAGAFMNFVFGVLAFTLIFTVVGIPVVTGPVTIAQVDEGPAKVGGLQAGDVVIEAGQQGKLIPVTNTDSFRTWLINHPDTDVVFTVLRGDEKKTLTAHTRSCKEIGPTTGALGVLLDQPQELRRYPWYEMPIRSAVIGTTRSLQFSKDILVSLFKMGKDAVTCGKAPTDVSGPVGIVSEFHKQRVFSQGFLYVLNVLAVLSINLAVMNVLPIPALDGGRALFILIESIVGRKRIHHIEAQAHAIGFMLLIGLIILISLKDVITLFIQR